MTAAAHKGLLVARCEWAARACALAVALLGVVVLVGWGLDVAVLKCILPGWVSMKANTALGFFLAGVSLYAASRRRSAPAWRHAHGGLAATLVLLGLLTVAEYAFAADIGIDQWLFRAPGGTDPNVAPGRMALATAAGLGFTGLALLFMDSGRARILSQLSALVGGLVGLLAVLGYAYDVKSLYGVGAYSSVALHTALGLMAINLGVVAVRPRRGLMALVISGSVGGVMARRLLPVALVAPFLIGWLRVQGEHRGLYGSEFGVALVTLVYVALFGAFIWRTASVLHDSDAGRSRAESAGRQQQAQLNGIIDSAMDAVLMVDARQRIVVFNPAAEQMFGRRAADMLGQPLDPLLPARFRAVHGENIRAFGATGASRHPAGGLRAFIGLRMDGEEFPVEATISQLDVNGERFFTVILRDVTQRHVAEEEIRHLAFYDSLTHLPNRRLLLDRLQQALAGAARSHRHGALLFIDVDNFKTLNDTLGHDTGDALLREVAHRLTCWLRDGDTVARLGGDEFVVMLENLSELGDEAASQAELVGEKILAALSQAYLLGGHEHLGSASIGVTLFGGLQETTDDLLKQADLAMYQAKAAGRNALRFFDPEMQAVVSARAMLETELRNGIREGQFILHYQAQVDADGQVMGAEALVRWQHPRLGMVFPTAFIPLAEETGLILPLGLWVLEAACAQLGAWAARPETAGLSLAVNVSGRQLHQADFVEQVLGGLERNGAAPGKLKLELTESLLMDDVEGSIAKMNALKARGVGFALDDFGTGYSSLAYLKLLPLTLLKIDRSFVTDILSDPNAAAIATTVVALARSLGLAVIAEGVETEAQRRFLAQNGCDACQGYLFSRPLPLAAFEDLLRLKERGVL